MPGHLRRQRKDYKFWQIHQTRWSDNDQYGHINNSVYAHLFDSIVNTYLIQHCSLSPLTSKSIGLVVKSWAEYLGPTSFPAVLDLGLRVTLLGRSSVDYEVAIFEHGQDDVRVVGGYRHVFVDAANRGSQELSTDVRRGLELLYVSGANQERAKL